MRKLLLAVLISIATSARAPAPQPDGGRVASGMLPDRWQVSGPDCPPDPHFQVHEYNADLVILRESGCSNYEKPFLFLIFGSSKVLLLDTGAGRTDVAQVVRDVIARWRARNGRDAIQLVVAHTHAHGDHIAGDSQLRALPSTTVAGLSPEAVQRFFGFRHWPDEIVPLDLGNRIVDVIPIPGHEPSSVAMYDHRTGLLFTGDTLYPGRLYVGDGAAFARSIQRLVDFTRGKIVTHILGNHIEQTRTPYRDYPVGTVYQPEEHALELGRAHLLELNDMLRSMNGAVVRTAMRDFTIWPR